MADYFARKAGNINATDVWATTPSGSAADVWSTFTSADVLHSNNFAITVNVSTTVGTVRNDNANSATAGGSFTLSNGVTLTANVIAAATCLIFNGTSGNSASLIGNVTGGTASNGFGANNTSSGTLNITGNATAGVSSAGVNNQHGANNASTGIINITGNVEGASSGSGTAGNGANNASTGTLNITGNATGGTVGGGTASGGANNASTGTVNITGNCTGGPQGNGANNLSTGTLSITGNCTGSTSTALVVGANNASTGTMIVTGSIYASEQANGVSGSNRAQVTRLTGPFYTTPTFGVNPIGCLAWRWDTSLVNTTFIEVPTQDLASKRNLVTPDNATNLPSASNVRSGTTYGISGALTGTCAVPPAASVATGVPVDNTTGTASLTPADFWNALTSGMTTSGSIGVRLKNASTLDSTGQQLADALSP